MKIVVFFGAGFSSAWGLPMMRDFFAHAKTADYISEDDKEFLTRLRARAQASHRMLEVRPGNLEDILSLCFASGQFAGNFPEEVSEDYKKLCRILQQVYKSVEIGGSMNLFYSNLKISSVEKLLGLKGERRVDISLITTNYDIILEFCLWKLHMPCRLPFAWHPPKGKQADLRDHLYTLDKKDLSTVLCKLHGSINWFHSIDERSRIRVESRIFRRRMDVDGGLDDESHEDNPQSKMIEQPYFSMRDDINDDVPIIIPPIVFKVQTHPCFIPIWEAARQALQEADKVVFIGYSFPDSDNYLRYFLASNLTKPDLDKIQIIAPHATNICKKLAKSNFGSYFKNLLEPVDTKWQSGEYSVVD